MYVAQRQLKVQDGLTPEGKARIRLVAPGEPVPEALKWPQTVLLAHLNLEWLRWQSAEEAPHKAPGRVVVDLRSYRGEKQNSPEGVTETALAPESTPNTTPEGGVTPVTTLSEDTATTEFLTKEGAKAAETATPNLSKRERREQKKKQQRGA